MSTTENSVRADLDAAIKEHAEVETEVVETPVVEAAAEVESAEQQERARDDKGRFIARSPAEAGSTAEQGAADLDKGKPGAAGEVAAAQPAIAAVQEPTKEQALAPPNGWSAEAKAKWHELSPEIMAAVQQREKDIAKFTSTRDEHASFGKEIYQTVQPYLAQIQAEGGTPATAIKSLLNTAHILRFGTPEQKRNALLIAAQQFQVDLGQQQGQPAATGLEPLQQRLDRLESERQQERTRADQQLQAEVQTELQAFAADPKHPHYETVKGHMSALIGQGAAKDLQDAYEQAVWARPDTRATLLAQQRAEEEQKRRTEAKAKAEAAKKKSVGITGGPGNTANASAPGSRSLREELESNFAASSGSV